MGVTIKQIAAEAGVHRSTVDKVIHNRPGVSSEVRLKIQKLLDEKGYKVNPIGQALQMQSRKFNIAVILLDVDALQYLKKGISDKLKEYASFKISCEFYQNKYSQLDKQIDCLKMCRLNKVDGIILNPINVGLVSDEIDLCFKAGIPVITLHNDIESKRISFVGQNEYRAGMIAARFMGEFLRGRGRVAVISADENNAREEGFRHVIGEEFKNIQLLSGLYTYDNSEAMSRIVSRLFENSENTDGIFITGGAVKSACDMLKQKNAVKIPVICFEEYPEILELIKEGTVTLTFGSGLYDQGAVSLDLLLQKIIYGKDPAKKYIYSDIQPIVKESL